MFTFFWFLTPSFLCGFVSFLLSPGTWLFWPQTGPDCQCLSALRFPLLPPGPGGRLRCHSPLSFCSFVVRFSLSLLPLVFGVSCPFPSSRLTVSPLLSLLVFPLFPASDSSGRRLVRVIRALAPPLFLPLLFVCFLLHPRVLCLVFLAADWSGFPAPPSSPSFLLSFTSLIPDLFSRRDL